MCALVVLRQCGCCSSYALCCCRPGSSVEWDTYAAAASTVSSATAAVSAGRVSVAACAAGDTYACTDLNHVDQVLLTLHDVTWSFGGCLLTIKDGFDAAIRQRLCSHSRPSYAGRGPWASELSSLILFD
jgi:hypothetical protein